MDDVCNQTGCEAQAEHAVWTTRTKDGDVRTTVQWAYWQDTRVPPKKADKLCASHTQSLLSSMAGSLGGGE